MDNGRFAKALSDYLNGLPESGSFDQHTHHMPDSLYLAVQSFEDFREFLSFISGNADHGGYFELRDDFEATEFLARWSGHLTDPRHHDHLAGLGSASVWSVLAYSVVLSIGN